MTVNETQARTNTGLFAYIKPVQNWILDLLFPPRCIHCGRVDAQFCEVCAMTLDAAPINLLKSDTTHLEALASTGEHSDVLQSAVQALKYNNARHLAPILAKRMLTVLTQQSWMFDMIVPVPLHTHRLQERGYNQAKEIAAALAEMLGVPCESDALTKTENTRSQVGLSRMERIDNVKEAFIAKSEFITGKALLLVDDVYTTGATLNACTLAAKQAGATAVYGLTVTVARMN